MGVLTEVVEGWSGTLPVICKADAVAVDLSGLTVSAVVKDRRSVAVATSSNFSVTGTTAGQVTWSPSSSDLTRARSPYSIRVKVVDVAGDIVYFPNGAADTVVVHAE